MFSVQCIYVDLASKKVLEVDQINLCHINTSYFIKVLLSGSGDPVDFT